MRGRSPAASCLRTWGQGKTCHSGPTPDPWSDKLPPSSPLGLESFPCLGLGDRIALHSLPGLPLPLFLLPLSLWPEARESSQPGLDPPLHPRAASVFPHKELLSHCLCFLPLPQPSSTSSRLTSWLSPSGLPSPLFFFPVRATLMPCPQDLPSEFCLLKAGP